MKLIVFFLSLIVSTAFAQMLNAPDLKSYTVSAVTEVKAVCDDEVEPTLVLPGCFLNVKEKTKAKNAVATKFYANPELCALKVGDMVELAYRDADCDVSFGLKCASYKNNRVDLKRKDEYFACVVRNRELVTAYKSKKQKHSVIRIYNEEKMAYENFAP